MPVADLLRNLVFPDERTSSPTPLDRPAREALRAKLREINAKSARRARIGHDIGVRQRDIQANDALQSQIDTRQTERDRAVALAEYSGESPPDVAEMDQDIAQLRVQLVPLAKRARDGKLVCAQLQAESDALMKEVATLQAEADELLELAVHEALTATAPDRLAAEKVFRAAQRRTYVALVALQKVAQRRGRPRPLGAWQYAGTHLPKPPLPAFGHVEYSDDFAKGRALAEEHAAHKADVQSIEVEADELINELLRLAHGL